MKLAFASPVKGKTTANGELFDKLICWKTGSPYCHVELVIDNPIQPLFQSVCFSSSPDDEGVRFKVIDLTQPGWTIVNLVSGYDAQAKSVATKYLGEAYDWLGIFGFVLPFGEHDDRDKFCSEVCALVLQRLQLIPSWIRTWEVSPGDLFHIVSTYKVSDP